MSGRKEIIATDPILTFDSKSPCDVKFFVNDETLKMRLRFKHAAGDEPPKIDFSEEEGIFTVNFTNFDDIAGRGNNKPIEIGESNERKIFMNGTPQTTTLDFKFNLHLPSPRKVRIITQRDDYGRIMHSTPPPLNF